MHSRQIINVFVYIAALFIWGLTWTEQGMVKASSSDVENEIPWTSPFTFEVIEDEKKSELFLIDAGRKKLIYSSHPAGIPSDLVALSPDQSHIAFVEMLPSENWQIKSRIILINLVDGEISTIVESEHGSWYTNPLWSPDATHFVYIEITMQTGSTDLWLTDTKTKVLQQLKTQDQFHPVINLNQTDGLRWSPGGEAVHFWNDQSKLWYELVLISQTLKPLAVDPSLQPSPLKEFSLLAYSGMQKPVNVRDYDGTCGNGYTGLYPSYGNCPLGWIDGHPAVDIGLTTDTACGTPVVAICDGTIYKAVTQSGITPSGNVCGNNMLDTYIWPQHLGKYVILKCDNIPNADYNGSTYGGTIYTVYAHLSGLSVSTNQSVTKGQQLGFLGSTGNSSGPHLHFQMENTSQGTHPGYWYDAPSIYAYTWNPMYFIQAHLNTTPSNDRIVNPPALTPATVSCTNAWRKVAAGTFGNFYDVYLTANAQTTAQSTNKATWTPNLPVRGLYRVQAYIGNHDAAFCGQNPAPQWDTSNARYTLYYEGGSKTVAVDQAPLTNQWATIDTKCFNAGTAGRVELTDLTYEASLSRTVSFSAMKFEYVGTCEPASCYTLSYSVSPSGSGTITANPAPNCNNGTQYTSGTSVTVSAAANTGFQFMNWSGASTSTASQITLTMDANKTVTANLTPLCYTLDLRKFPPEGGSVTQNPSPNCNETKYAHGTVVQLSASPTNGFLFDQWGGNISATTLATSVTMNGDRYVFASFNEAHLVFVPSCTR
jgi:murein DD-endopeptidase MepM/ murein hydrolase activator NlpD